MKSQIFAGIALFIAGVYTVEVNKSHEPKIQPKEVKVITTQELIERSSLNEMTKKIEERQDTVSLLIRESIDDKIVDSVIQPKQDSVIE